MLGFIHFLPPSIRAAASPTSRERARFERAKIALSRNDSVAFQEILQKDWSLLHHLVSPVDFPAITQPLSSMMQEIMQTLSPTELIQWRGFDVNYCPTSGPMHVESHFICFLVIFENMHGCSTATEILGTTSEEYMARNMRALAQA